MLRGRGGSERGSVAITVALAMTVLLGFAALVVDVGLNWAARTSAQTAADSAALAGAAQLLSDGPAVAIGAVRDYLNDNVSGLADAPADPNWPTNANPGDGEVVCWTLPDPPPNPPPGGLANCPLGSNALQVITPPITVDYAFAGVLGETSNAIRAMAAAGAGPAAPNNCVLCLLDPDDDGALLSLVGGVDVDGGGIAVNSDDLLALQIQGAGDIVANQIRVVGGFVDSGLGQFVPPPERGGPPVPDPLAGVPRPNLRPSPPMPVPPAQRVVDTSTDMTISQGVYDSITVSGSATLTLQAGVYVIRGFGLTVRGDASLVGDGVTIYLACGRYPAPCSESGARFRLLENGEFLADPPSTGDYAGLSIFADRGNRRTIRLRSTAPLNLGGALYGANTPLVLDPLGTGGLQVYSLLVVDSLRLEGVGSVAVDYDPSGPLPGVGRPVLIR